MRVHPALQGSGEWMVARAKYLTASNFGKWLTPAVLKISTSETAQGLVRLAACAEVFGVIDEPFSTFAMERGTELEIEARAWYAFQYAPVAEVGFCIADDDSCGCSPDGLVGDDGGVEIKCPGLPQHLANLMSDEVPAEYRMQVQGCLYVTGREWWDWISYYPGLPAKVIRCLPDAKVQAAIRAAVEEFNRQKAALVEKFSALKAE